MINDRGLNPDANGSFPEYVFEVFLKQLVKIYVGKLQINLTDAWQTNSILIYTQI
jgi:hypothetical protein